MLASTGFPRGSHSLRLQRQVLDRQSDPLGNAEAPAKQTLHLHPQEDQTRYLGWKAGFPSELPRQDQHPSPPQSQDSHHELANAYRSSGFAN